MQEFADKHALNVARWWIDDHVSGSSVEGRLAFDTMIEESRRTTEVAGILVWNMSRWARNDLESQFYRADFRLRGYAVVSVADDIPGGDLALIMESLLDYKNRKYLEDLSKDTRRGLRDTVLREITTDGQTFTGFSGGGFPPRGYRAKYIETGRRKNGSPRMNAVWEFHPDWQERVARARAMYAAGEPVQKIHDECRIFAGLPGYKTFWPCATYAGIRRCGEVSVLGAHPPYDDALQRAKIEARIAAEKRPHVSRPRTQARQMLSGLAHCGYCGSVLHGHADHYYCAKSQRSGSDCKARRIGCKVLDAAVIGWLRTVVWTPDALAATVEAINKSRAGAVDETEQEAQRIRKEQAKLAKQINNLVNAIADGGSKALVGRIREIEQQQEANEARLRLLAIETREVSPINWSIGKIKGIIDELHALLEGADQERVWAIVRDWVQRVDVYDDRAEAIPVIALEELRQRRICSYPQREVNVSGVLRFGKRYRRA